ncbi:acyl-CoA dehydrogenase family protein, partial [Bacillus pumilus]|uniref:acyl-CoA dehydrogenase family protein n=1 Tax=Bacillus pumilus TaxID=1408 RepID=UPI002905740E
MYKRQLPESLIRDMAKRGYLAAGIPPSYQGLGLDPIAYGQFTEQVGKACLLYTSDAADEQLLVFVWGGGGGVKGGGGGGGGGGG